VVLVPVVFVPMFIYTAFSKQISKHIAVVSIHTHPIGRCAVSCFREQNCSCEGIISRMFLKIMNSC